MTDRTREPNDPPKDAEANGATPGFRFDCEFCDEMLRTETETTIKSEGAAHLEDRHSTDLVEAFAEKARGSGCENDCGYVFPADVEEVAGFDCPACGHDHSRSFVRRYLYWRIEEA